MLAAQHLLRYLLGTYELGIKSHCDAFHADQLWGWVDADWAGDIETRRSHTGYVLMLIRDFGVTQTQPTLIYKDNLACIAMLSTPFAENILIISTFTDTTFAKCAWEIWLTWCLLAQILWWPMP